MPTIIAFQATKDGQAVVRDILQSLAFTEGTDFVVVDDHEDVLPCIAGVTPQLLIMGSIGGEDEVDETEDFLKQVRAKNPHLLCVGFALSDLPGDYDQQILKGRETSLLELRTIIRHFDEGQLKRAAFPEQP